MGKALTDFGLQAAQGAIGAGMGMLLGGYNDRRQLKQEQKLQNLQIKGQKEMTDYNFEKQLQMWKDTNYKAQTEELRKAGLNPGLLYGMSGGGATTTGGGGGNVGRGTAPTGGGEAQAMAGMTMQLGLMRAQKENIEADTKLKETDATKKAGIDTQEAQSRILNLTQDVQNKKAQEILTQVQTRIQNIEESIKGRTEEDTVRAIGWNAEKVMQEMEQARFETNIAEATWRTKVEIVQTELIGMYLKNTQTQTQTQLTNQQITQTANKIVQDWKQLEINSQNANTQQKQQMLNAWVNDVKNSTKLVAETIGDIIESVLRKTPKMKGSTSETHGPKGSTYTETTHQY